MTALSIVIPVAHAAEPLLPLLTRLREGLPGAQLIVAGPEAVRHLAYKLADDFVCAEHGRAQAMNRGGALARQETIWFLHVDSDFPADVAACFDALSSRPDSLWYFDLSFSDGPAWMPVNAVGVWLRSHCLRCPFGDQGLVMRRATWRMLGGFPEGLAYGEDHAFVWLARRAGIPLRFIGATLGTSGRKYQQRGWRQTTARHLRLWWSQAIAEWRKS